MKINQDIEQAENSHIEMENGNAVSRVGHNCSKLLNSSDFFLTDFTFSVWEVTSDTRDWRTCGENFACILRANQSTLEGALKYMTGSNRVLVHNKNIPESLPVA